MLGTKKEVYLATSDELDDLIHQQYPQRGDWESIAAEEWNNYSCYDFDIKKEPHDRYNFGKLEQFKMGAKSGYHLMTRILLTDLVNRGKIPEGLYIIKVYW